MTCLTAAIASRRSAGSSLRYSSTVVALLWTISMGTLAEDLEAVALQLDDVGVERLFRGPLEDRAVGLVARPVARTVERILLGVQVDLGAAVGALDRDAVESALRPPHKDKAFGVRDSDLHLRADLG